jgi:hypothetical protein
MMLLTYKYEKYHSGNDRTVAYRDLSPRNGNKPPNIIKRFDDVYGDSATKQTQMDFWVTEILRGREDLTDNEQLGRQPDISLDEVLSYKFEAGPHTKARKIADSLVISL